MTLWVGMGSSIFASNFAFFMSFYDGEPFRIQVLSFYDEEPFRIQVLSLTDWKSQRLEENQQDYNTHFTIEC